MSYNGIGLKSAKGSSTSGHIQRNISCVKKERKGQSEGKQFLERQLIKQRDDKTEKQRHKSSTLLIEKDLDEHEKRRQIEVKVAKYRDQLEEEVEEGNEEETDEGKIDEIISCKVALYRKKLLAQHKKAQRVPYTKRVNPFLGSKTSK